MRWQGNSESSALFPAHIVVAAINEQSSLGARDAGKRGNRGSVASLNPSSFYMSEQHALGRLRFFASCIGGQGVSP